MREQDEETCLVVHIETRRGYENAEEIISTPGVDMVYVGPGDFSIEMGHPGDYDHPEVTGPLREILALCKNIMCHSVPQPLVLAAEQLVALGAQFFETSDELALILDAARGLVGAYRQFCPVL